MSLLLIPALTWAVFTGLTVSGVLLWFDRGRLLGDDDLKRISTLRAAFNRAGLYLLIPVLFTVAVVVLVQGVQTANSAKAISNTQHEPGHKIKQLKPTATKKPAKETPNKTPEDEGNDSEKFTLALTALGIFVTLVTAISLAVARQATEDARQAGEDINRASEELGVWRQVREQEVLIRVQQTRVSAVVELARAPFSRGINASDLLERKLRFLDESARFRESAFSLSTLAHRADSLKNALDNPAYQGHLRKWINRDDRQSIEQLLSHLRQGPPRADMDAADRALVALLRRLESLS